MGSASLRYVHRRAGICRRLWLLLSFDCWHSLHLSTEQVSTSEASADVLADGVRRLGTPIRPAGGCESPARCRRRSAAPAHAGTVRRRVRPQDVQAWAALLGWGRPREAVRRDVGGAFPEARRGGWRAPARSRRRSAGPARAGTERRRVRPRGGRRRDAAGCALPAKATAATWTRRGSGALPQADGGLQGAPARPSAAPGTCRNSAAPRPAARPARKGGWGGHCWRKPAAATWTTPTSEALPPADGGLQRPPGRRSAAPAHTRKVPRRVRPEDGRRGDAAGWVLRTQAGRRDMDAANFWGPSAG